MTPQRIIWHHSADDYQGKQLAKIDAYHKSRGFPRSNRGYYVGYHYLIERNGEVVQTRDDTEVGAHDQGENHNSIGICLAGNFNKQMPSEAQIKAAAQLIKHIRKQWDIPITRIEPHRWDDNTDCPGLLLPDNWLIKTYLVHEGSALLRVWYSLGELLKLV